jgi:hypothetical protein
MTRKLGVNEPGVMSMSIRKESEQGGNKKEGIQKQDVTMSGECGPKAEL